MAQEFKIGRLRYTWRGIWATATFYNRDAVAAFDGKTYVCIVPHTSTNFYDNYFNVEPSGEVKPYWTLMLDGQSWVGEWAPTTAYTLSNIVLYAGTVYKCITNHTSTATFDPTKWQVYVAVDSSWVNVYTPSVFYYKGDVAKFGGIVYKCNVDHLASAAYFPDYTKWDLQYEGIEFKGEWDLNSVQYKQNDIVKYGASLWICQFNHTSSSGFDGTIDTDDSTKAWLLWIPGAEYENTWSSLITYQLGDVVMYGGYSYISRVVNNTNLVPPDAADDSTPAWQLLTTGYKFLGQWQNSTTYNIGSVVRDGGTLYQAIKDNINQSPTDNIVTTTYNSTGSSGRTLKVASTSNLSPGMFISGQGFSKGQYIDSIVDGTTLKISQSPYSSISNGATLTFSSVDTENWEIITQGIRWRNRWASNQSYLTGDITVYVNKTYRCIRNHTSATINRPDQDTNNVYWVIFLNHDRNNVLNDLGDIIVNSQGTNIALPIGPEGYLLKSIYGVPTWSNFLQTPKVYYVTPTGTDSVGSGTTWDNPWRSIKYACDQISAGLSNPSAKILLSINRNFIEEEAYQWQNYQITNSIAPFNIPGLTLDEEKTRRDTKYLVDAVTYDLARGGNSQIIAFTLAFFDKVARFKYATEEVSQQIDYYVATINKIFDLMNTIASGSTVSPLYQTLNGITNPIVQQAGPTLSTQSIIDIESFRGIVVTALNSGDSREIPPENSGLTATIQVKTGTYREELPIVLPANTALNGDELRGVVVYPKVIINSLVTRSFAGTNTFRCGSTAGMTAGTPVQFDSIYSVNGVNSVFGNVQRGITYYVIGSSITPTDFSVSTTPNGLPVELINFTSHMYVYGGDALKDMFRCQNGTGIRNMTLAGLLGCLSNENIYQTRRPTGGAYVGLDVGANQDDTSAWIYRKSPYIQNVTTFGRGAVGLKIDGSYHNGGNKSIVCNDFTQIISDGIGIWCTGTDSLCEAVSVFSYYAYAGYFAEAGGRIRATNGNSSYGTFGVVAEGFDASEVPISGLVNNQYYEAQATPFSSLGSEAEILKIQYSHAGQSYNNEVTNLIRYSNNFTYFTFGGVDGWETDNNLTLVQSITSPFGTTDGWLAEGTSSTGLSGVLSTTLSITPSGASYTSLAGTNITGSGINATFDVVVSSTSYLVTINSGGSGYVVSNQIRILGTQLGGTTPANDLVITVTGLSGTTITGISTLGTVQSGATQPYYFSIYIKKGTSPTFYVAAEFSGTTTSGSTINYNFDTGTITPGNILGGTLPVVYSATPVSNTNGWIRLSFVTYDNIALNNTLKIKLYPKGTSSITGYSFIYGAQLEAGNSLGFYLASQGHRYTANANFVIQGPGSNVDLVANEIRTAGVYKTRILEVDRITGGKGYLFSANNAQAGNASSLTIAASDTTGEKPYLGMRLFVNNGLGAGQYGTIAFYNPTTKEATVLKESFSQLEITQTVASTDKFSLSLAADPYSLYVDQPVRFVPTHYEIDIDRISQDDVNVLSTIGGLQNRLVVTSTTKLTLGMAINFSGTTFGGVTSDFTYYIINIIDETNLQVSTTLGGSVVFLNNATGDMQLNFPAFTSYLSGSTTNMSVNLPIFFTGNVLSEVVAGQTYYINEIFGSNLFTISPTLINVTATATTVNTNLITVSDTSNLVSLTPIVFTDVIGGLSNNFKYYIKHVSGPTQFSLTDTITTTTATASVESSDLITVVSTTGFTIGNPIVFTGPTFGGIINDQIYYIHYVNDGTTFSISNTSTLLTLSVTATSASNNAITVGSTTNLTPLNPIVFRGTAFGNLISGQTYYVNRVLSATEFTITALALSVIATNTAAISNLITVSSTTGFQANNPIIFGGNTFGGIVSGQIYYISAVNDSTSFTISDTPGGSAVTLTTGTGTLVARTGPTLAQSTATGTMTGYSRFTNVPVSLTSAVGEIIVRTTGADVALTTATGSMLGTTTSAKTVLSADAGSNMTGTFTVPLLGGIDSSTTYYIRTIDTTSTPATFSVTTTSGGSTDVQITDGTGSMQVGEVGWDHINSGTPLANTFDSTSSYTIEPRVYYEKPEFSIVSSSIYTQTDPAAVYVDIGFGKSTFAAIPAKGTTLAVSTTGLDWTTTELPLSPGGTASWSSIAYGNSYWVIIANGNSGGAGSRVLYSNSNLATWKSSSLPSNSSWNYLVYGNGNFVAINDAGSVAYSTSNGLTWNTGFGFNSGTYKGLAYGKSIFVAVRTGTATASRSNSGGVSWSNITLPRSDTWSAIAFGDGRFVVISSTLSKPVYSFDGLTWYTGLYNIVGTVLTYGNGLFVATDPTTNVAYYSEDGVSWTRSVGLLGCGVGIFGITGGNGRIITVNGLGDSKAISGGARIKARPVVSNGSIVEINEWEPGGNYNSDPDVFIADTNATVKATVTPLRGSGILAGPTFVNRGSGYNTLTTTIDIYGDGYANDFQTGISLIFNNLTRLPSPGDNLSITGDTTIYKVTSAVALDGTVPPSITARIDISPEMTVGKSPTHATTIAIRTKYSQARLTNHDFLNIGYGNFEESNYPRLPIETVLSPQNETVESNYGRVFYSSTDQDGNFRVGELFAVEQATGIVTLSASQFGLEGLNELSIGGVSIGGSSVVITQFSTDETFTSNSNNIIPTQRAIKSYLSARLTQGGSNTFTGELTAGTVKVGGPDRIQSTVPEGNVGSRVKIPVKANISGSENGMIDGDGMALSYFFKTLITDRGVPNGQ